MEMNGLAWWYLVLKVQLLIGGVEKNPGPKKGKKSFSTRSSTDKKRKQASRYHLTEEEKAAVCKQETSSRAHRRLNLSEEDKKVNRFQQTTARRNKRATLREEEIAAIRSRETTGRTQNRRSLSKEKKIQITSKDTKARRDKRKNSTIEQRAVTRSMETASKKFRRQLLDDEETTAVRSRESRGRRKVREDLAKEDKMEIRTKDTTAKRHKRDNLHEQESFAVRSRETSSRKRKRKNLDEEQCGDVRFRETSSRKRRRKNLDEEQCGDIRSRETSSRKRKRKNLDEEKCGDIRSRETSSRKCRRKNLDEDTKAGVRCRETMGKKQKRLDVKKMGTDIHFVRQRFQQSVKEGPTYDCCSCRRLLYRQSVLCYTVKRYKKTSASLLDCCGGNETSSKKFICKTCDASLKKDKMPCQAEANNLYFDNIPDALQDLCPLEQRLISQRLPFMQIASLPRGGQKGIKGAVVNVPAQIDTIVKTLPRMPTDCGLVPVKLKKKLEYKGHSLYQSIRPQAVLRALQCLKESNPLYKDVHLDKDWLTKCEEEEDEELCSALIEAEQQIFRNISDSDEPEDECAEESKESSDKTSDNSEDSEDKLRGIPYNTCLQPADEIPGNHVFCFAPGEGERPVSLLTDNQCEVLAFPSIFPTGKFGHYDQTRPVGLSCRKYFNQRLLNVDRRCASNVEFLFFAQYFTELKQVLDNINIAVRLCKPSQKTAGTIKNSLQDMIQNNDAYKFLQTVRGSQPYWKRTLHDLCAMVRQLDIPTWFITFSAADMMWTEPIQIIAQQQGVTLTDEEVKSLDWQEKCNWIRSNPVTAARHFQFRAQKFIHGVLMSDAHPVGHIVDYFYRVEFQQRGSPHLHCLFWVKDAPKIGHNTEKEICSFIDTYVSCNIPDSETDPDLYTLVDKVQRHSHSSSCMKSGRGCRFHFPKAPTSETLIADIANIETTEPALIKIRKEENAAILKKVYDCLAEHPTYSFDDLLLGAEVRKDVYLKALSQSTSSPTVIPARQPFHSYINNYNPDLLRIWQANMDIQFVTDPWACAMYILSYITKGERQMGELLKHAAEQCKEDDSIRQQMKTLGNVFLTHREVSGQEAAYRALSLNLKKSSRQVVFVNTSMAKDRVRILKPKSQLKDLPDDSTDIYQVGILERYSARPASLQDCCLADFATSYRLLSMSSTEDELEDPDDEEGDEVIPSKKIHLQFRLGTMYKRRKGAVIRTPRFSRVKFPEKFFHSALMLYLPWRNEKELLANYQSYEQHFDAVREEVEATISSFETDDCMIDEALKVLQTEGPPTQAWDNLAPETQQQEGDDESEGKKLSEEHSHLQPQGPAEPPELSSVNPMGYAIQNQTSTMPTEQYQHLVQSLNTEQRQIYDRIHLWCREVLQGRKTGITPPPFYMFVTGGAGTGKSHLIKAVQNMARKELHPICDSADEVTVLIAAPTGIAALNVEGSTIHSTFSIPVSNYGRSTYETMSHDKKASLRNSLKNLKIVIIDEISMVGYTTLLQIHRRLQDIMGTIKNDVYFGGVSVMAVGDFYQLDPVKKSPVFQPPSDSYASLNPFHMWKDLFLLAELQQIMRQKSDRHFAELLNRARIGELNSDDLDTLKSRIISPDDDNYPHDSLHAFPTNVQVDNHNTKMMSALNTPLRHMHAVDARKDIQTGKADVKVPDDPSKTGGLKEVLSLCVGCRVMVTKNISIEDGLVNGVQGSVVGFIESKGKSIHSPTAILVKFDNAQVGKQLRKKFSTSTEGTTPITPVEAKFSVGKYNNVDITRTQFPLTLSFACTIHKVQGLSVDEIVISLDGRLQPGQAYVALSRARTLEGLHLLDFDPKKVKESPKVDKEINRMRRYMPVTIPASLATLPDKAYFKISHINCRSLVCHFNDVSHHAQLLSSHVICISETWLQERHSTDAFNLPEYTMYRRDRLESYNDHSCPQVESQTCQKCNSKGGVAVYVRKDKVAMLPDDVYPSKSDTEMLKIALKDDNLGTIILLHLYRPQHCSLYDLYSQLNQEVSAILVAGYPVVVIGDFNDDLFKTSTSGHCSLTSLGLQQIISDPTHMYGSLLDHIYTNLSVKGAISGVIPAYYSDHNAVFIALKASEHNTSNTKLLLCQSPKEPKHKSRPATENRRCHKVLHENINPSVHKTGCKVTRSKSREEDPVLLQVERPTLQVISLEPPTLEDRQSVANYFGVPAQQNKEVNPELYDHRYTQLSRYLHLQTPGSHIDMIEPDGNCFFRSISKEILGTEKYHSKVRKRLCDFISDHRNTFQNWTEGGAAGFTRHVQNMRKARVWATEVEIIATSTFFNTSIYEFTEEYIEGHNTSLRWVRFQPIQLSVEDPPNDGCPIEGNFYLHHTWGVHYDRVYSLPQGKV